MSEGTFAMSRSVETPTKIASGWSRHWGLIAVAAVFVPALLVSLALHRTLARGVSAEGLFAAQATYDFGRIKPTVAGRLEHDFVLLNATRAPIRIIRALTSCGCTAARLPDHPLAPSESAIVPVSVDWGGRDGSQIAAVTFSTDPPGRPLVLRLSAYIDNPVAVWPRALRFGSVEPGLSKEQRFEIISFKEGLKITRVETTNGAIVVNTVQTGSGDGRTTETFGVRVDAPTESKTVAGRVLVYTNLQEQPFQVDVSSEATGAVVATPESLVIRCSSREPGAVAPFGSASSSALVPRTSTH